MSNKVYTTKSEKAIFNETSTSLATIDEQYRRDSDLYAEHRKIHEERILESKLEIERLEAIAARRGEELAARREKLMATALKLYEISPEVSNDREQVFALAEQVTHGRVFENSELKNAVSGLLAIDDAIKHGDPILRYSNGGFDSLTIPNRTHSGLVLAFEPNRYKNGKERVVARLDLHAETSITFNKHIFLENQLFPHISQPQYDLIGEFTTVDASWGHQTRQAARVGTSFDVRGGVLREPESDKTGVERTTYLVGRELINKAIANSSYEHPRGHGPNASFAYMGWLAGKLCGYDFDCTWKTIKPQVMRASQKILNEYMSSYQKQHGIPPIGSETAKILIGSVRKKEAEDELYKYFCEYIEKEYKSTFYSNKNVRDELFRLALDMSIDPST